MTPLDNSDRFRYTPKAMLHKGSLFILAGLPLVLAGVVGLKVSGLDACWVLIALGAVTGVAGGVQLSLPVAK